MTKEEIAIEALKRIKSPISFMQNELQEGERLNGQYAIQLANNAKYLQSIAEKALTKISSLPQSSTEEENEDWKYQAKALSAIKKGLELSVKELSEECERLAKLAEFWQNKYQSEHPGWQPPKIDNL